MKDGAILANSGHFNGEINVDALHEMATKTFQPRRHVTTCFLPNGRRIQLLSEGRLVTLSAAEGHPSAVMDMSFANQALCVKHIVAQAKNETLECSVHSVPETIDQFVAELKLETMGLRVDELTDEQQRYLGSWQAGT